MASLKRAQARLRRKERVRKKIRGTPEKPRLSVFRSSKHIYAQIIDDGSAHTVLESSSLAKDIRATLGGRGGNREGAAIIGQSIAKKALEKGIKRVVFDRNGFLYHGRIKALAEAARETGLEF
ncbi:MAG: 50S ribosomal protein L18 [Deltaproteobacteria bacterium]|nr:50S ribosomal protein L18 [Deltaproteobacteria bacterium]MBW2205374.1 50S ribosomal protein L18 [Deltaproteobacteria bacterium]